MPGSGDTIGKEITCFWLNLYSRDFGTLEIVIGMENILDFQEISDCFEEVMIVSYTELQKKVYFENSLGINIYLNMREYLVMI